MNVFRKICTVIVAVVAAACFMCPAFAQNMEEQTVPDGGDLQRAADIVNLMRGIFAPDPNPVLASPAERAVSVRQAGSSAASASSVVTTAPVVTMPDIVIPDSDAEPDAVAAEKNVPDDAATQTAAAKKKASEDDADDDPPTFYYAFFFGEYVPYYRGWFYYSDRWLWGRRLPPPPGPPDWIPPPPPPHHPGDPIRLGPYVYPEIVGRSGSGSVSTGRSGVSSSSREQEIVRPIIPGIPVAPDAHRIPSRSGLQFNSPAKSDPIPVSPGAHRIPRKRDR